MDAQSIWLGAGWMVEIYCEHFADDLEHVAIFVVTEDEVQGHRREVTALACPSPEQAREIAAALIRVADLTDDKNRQRPNSSEHK